jgi:hypothetical protein
MTVERQCRKCLDFFPATADYFYRTRTGLRARCKTCIDAQVKDYVEANKDWLYAYQRDWKQQNKRKVKRQRTRYYKLNRDAIKNKQAAWNKANRAKGRGYERGYRQRRKVRRFQGIIERVAI